MLYLVTGMPGNGKTLYAVDWLLRQIETDVALVKSKGTAPRDFFTDIEGFDFDAVEKLTGRRVQPAPDDWRTTPVGSVIVYDEAHRRFPSTGKPGRSEDARVNQMDTHRHGGYDLMFITQWPSKVHHELRQLVGEHVHLHRAMGLESAGLYRWGRVQADPYDERQREKAEEEIWKFPKGRYALYKSSTLHTVSHKFRIPAKVWSALSMLAALLLLCWGVWAFVLKDKVQRPSKDAQQQAQGQAGLPAAAPAGLSETPPNPGTGVYAAISTEPAPALMGCVKSDRSCRCFNTDGFQIDMTRMDCEILLDNPLPFNIAHQYGGRGNGVQQRKEQPSQETRASASTVAGAVIGPGANSASSFPENPALPTTL